MSISVSARTTEQPFIVTRDGIFFRSANGFGIVMKRGSRSDETVLAVQEVLNKAFEIGFDEGVKAGIKVEINRSC